MEGVAGSVLQGVALSRALQQLAAQIEDHNRALRTRADAIPANIRGGLSIDDFCALPARPDLEDAIREAERALVAANKQETIRAAQEFEPVATCPARAVNIGSVGRKHCSRDDSAAILALF
jgi:hypothetical protein